MERLISPDYITILSLMKQGEHNSWIDRFRWLNDYFRLIMREERLEYRWGTHVILIAITSPVAGSDIKQHPEHLSQPTFMIGFPVRYLDARDWYQERK